MGFYRNVPEGSIPEPPNPLNPFDEQVEPDEDWTDDDWIEEDD